ncbi:MAG: hypothetical protein EHM81_09925 [Chloroflexi bacterium]|nr:MAG: hypothetical protein EHM81_09925 [Chloroflexota bacterium]
MHFLLTTWAVIASRVLGGESIYTQISFACLTGDCFTRLRMLVRNDIVLVDGRAATLFFEESLAYMKWTFYRKCAGLSYALNFISSDSYVGTKLSYFDVQASSDGLPSDSKQKPGRQTLTPARKTDYWLT